MKAVSRFTNVEDSLRLWYRLLALLGGIVITDRELDVLVAGTGRSREIGERSNLTIAEVNNYRRSLRVKGVLSSDNVPQGVFARRVESVTIEFVVDEEGDSEGA